MKFFLTFILITSSFNALCQTGVDSVLGKYLKEKKEIDSVEYCVITTKKGYNLISNYYVSIIDSFNLNEKKLALFKFGSYNSHARLHVALFLVGTLTSYRVFEGVNLRRDIISFFDFTDEFSFLPKRDFNKKQLAILSELLKIYSTD